MKIAPWLIAGVLKVAVSSRFVASASKVGDALSTVQFPWPLRK
jgi:hypothetical protein